MSESIQFKIAYTNNIVVNCKRDFISLQNEVFKNSFNDNTFKRKYEDNIFGPSIIVLAYKDTKCIGSRVFWRNDIDGIKAYQPCDTAVSEKYRGYGIFKEMTYKALEAIDSESLIYNFPNDNSLPGNLKMGWKVNQRKRYKIFNYLKDFSEIDEIGTDYLNWITKDYSPKDNLFYTYVKGKFFLIKKRKANIYLVLGEIPKDNALLLQKAHFPILMCYSNKGYLGRGLVSVIKNYEQGIHIPVYKMDTIFS